MSEKKKTKAKKSPAVILKDQELSDREQAEIKGGAAAGADGSTYSAGHFAIDLSGRSPAVGGSTRADVITYAPPPGKK